MNIIASSHTKTSETFLDYQRAWSNKATELSTWAKKNLIIRRDCYGRYYTKDGGVHQMCQKEYFTDQLLNLHFSLQRTFGSYAIQPGTNLVKWCAYDLDNHTHDDDVVYANKTFVHRILIKSLHFGLQPLAEDCGDGSWHVWYLWNEAIPARTARQFLYWLKDDITGDCEVFPKQDTITNYGNFLRMPGKHSKDERTSSFVDASKRYAKGEESVEYLLSFKSQSPSLIPEEAHQFIIPKKILTNTQDVQGKEIILGENWMESFEGDFRTLRVKDLFEAHNLLVSEDDEKYTIICPWVDDHTTGNDGTCIFHKKGYFPAFSCLHGHCEGRTFKDICAYFGRDEIDKYCEKHFTAAILKSQVKSQVLIEELEPELPKEETELPKPDTKKRLKPWTLTEMWAYKSKSRILIPDMMISGTHTLFSGREKKGKTHWLTNFISDLLANGLVCGHSVDPLPILYLDWEMGIDLFKGYYLQGFPGVDDPLFTNADSNFNYYSRDGGLLPSHLTTELLDEIIKEWKQPGIIINDTVRASFQGDKNVSKEPGWENQASTVGSVLRPITDWCHLSGWNLVSVHHHNKQGNYSGSTEFGASVDATWDFCQYDSDESNRILKVIGRGVSSSIKFHFEDGRYYLSQDKDEIEPWIITQYTDSAERPSFNKLKEWAIKDHAEKKVKFGWHAMHKVHKKMVKENRLPGSVP